MLNFNYCNPVRIYFGKGQVENLRQELSLDKRILLTYGGGSIKKNGVYDAVMKELEGYTVFEFGGIEPNPHYDTLVKAANVAKENNVDFLLAVGGGSVVDGTKFIAAAACFDGEPWDLVLKKYPVEAALPLGCVLTLPATGSEMNCNSVITKTDTCDKMPFIDPMVYPKFSILDPTYTFTLPSRQIANGIIDSFVHVIEQYLTYPVNAPLQDRFSEGILQTLIEEGPKTLKDPTDYDSRANFMWCATMALNGLIGQGVPGDWSTHMIGHEITAKYGLDHAQTLAIVLPSLMYVKHIGKKDKLLQYAERIWGVNEGSDEERIQQAIDKTRQFFESLGVGTHLSDYGIGEDAVPELVDQLSRHGRIDIGERGDISLEQSKEILTLSCK